MHIKYKLWAIFAICGLYTNIELVLDVFGWRLDRCYMMRRVKYELGKCIVQLYRRFAILGMSPGDGYGNWPGGKNWNPYGSYNHNLAEFKMPEHDASSRELYEARDLADSYWRNCKISGKGDPEKYKQYMNVIDSCFISGIEAFDQKLRIEDGYLHGYSCWMTNVPLLKYDEFCVVVRRMGDTSLVPIEMFRRRLVEIGYDRDTVLGIEELPYSRAMLLEVAKYSFIRTVKDIVMTCNWVERKKEQMDTYYMAQKCAFIGGLVRGKAWASSVHKAFMGALGERQVMRLIFEFL